jgi:hypothetical protein
MTFTGFNNNLNIKKDTEVKPVTKLPVETIKDVNLITIGKYRSRLGTLLQQKKKQLDLLPQEDDRRKKIVQQIMAIQANSLGLLTKKMSKNRFEKLNGQIASQYSSIGKNTTKKNLTKKSIIRKNITKKVTNKKN